MRGEYWHGEQEVRISFGSPPHAWGILTFITKRTRVPGSPPHAWGILLTGVTIASAAVSPPHAWGIRFT